MTNDTRSSLFQDVAGALANLVSEVEMDAARRSTAAGLGASEWEAFVSEAVFNALSLANDALFKSKDVGRV